MARAFSLRTLLLGEGGRGGGVGWGGVFISVQNVFTPLCPLPIDHFTVGKENKQRLQTFSFYPSRFECGNIHHQKWRCNGVSARPGVG